MRDELAVERIAEKCRWLFPLMDERMRRQWAAAEVRACGWGRVQATTVPLRIPLRVRLFPPGTGKCNKIEHRVFCHIAQNWRGLPLVSPEVIIRRIAKTTAQRGLKIRAERDSRCYLAGIPVSDREPAARNLKRDEFRGKWNYTLRPPRKNK